MRSAVKLLIGVLCLMLSALAAGDARAQPLSGEALAREFRDHVVTIRTNWSNGQKQDGFGFVVGQNSTGVYIVTANHVVRGVGGPGEVAQSVELTWFRRKGERFPATLIGTSDADRDIAVLRTKLPSGVTLRTDLMVYPPDRIQRGTEAWFVGRAREWYVPSLPGVVNSVDLNEQVLVDRLNLQVGTSGAPLITAEGIAGMIVEDAGGIARATTIGFIARAFEVWSHPWNMNPYERAPVPPVPPTPKPEPDRSASEQPRPDPGWFVFLGSFPQLNYSDARALQHKAEGQLPGETLIIDTNEYSNLSNGLYSVVIGAETRADAEAIQRRAVRIVSDAYIKQPGNYLEK